MPHVGKKKFPYTKAGKKKAKAYAVQTGKAVKAKPNNPALWSRAKAAARKKFDVYPSAYANAWASKWYKSKGGGWSGGNNKVAKRGKSKSKKA